MSEQPTNAELIEWCKKESNRNARMQGDKQHTCNRRHTFRRRNHMLAATADRLEAAEKARDLHWHKFGEWQKKAMIQLEAETENLLLTHIDWQKQTKRADKAEAAIKSLESELETTLKDKIYYKLCALSGEIPTDGSEPSSFVKEHGHD